jgi:hypothetical protein
VCRDRNDAAAQARALYLHESGQRFLAEGFSFSIAPLDGSSKNETPKGGLGDQAPEWRFCSPIPDTETRRYPRIAAVSRDFEGFRMLAGGDRTGWLPFLDTYRTMCCAPEPAFRRILEDIRDLPFGA